jgi:hypothetical protein
MPSSRFFHMCLPRDDLFWLLSRDCDKAKAGALKSNQRIERVNKQGMKSVPRKEN